MKADGLMENLEEIESVRVTQERGEIVVTTGLKGYHLRIKLDDVAGYGNIVSPYMQDCTRIDMKDGGFIIVTPDDIVFDVPEMAHVKVRGMPPVCPVTDIINEMNHFKSHLDDIESVNASPNIDGTVGSYVMCKHLLECALRRGINVDLLLEDLEKKAEEKGVKEVGALLERFEEEEG